MDVFDQLSPSAAPSPSPAGDVFDRVAPSRADVFDQVAAPASPAAPAPIAPAIAPTAPVGAIRPAPQHATLNYQAPGQPVTYLNEALREIHRTPGLDRAGQRAIIAKHQERAFGPAPVKRDFNQTVPPPNAVVQGINSVGKGMTDYARPLIATVAPQFAEKLGQDVEAAYPSEPGIVNSALRGAGMAIGAAPVMAATGGAGAGTVGVAQGVGMGREEAARRRAQDEDISGWQEAGLAAGYGAVQGVSQYIGGKMATQVIPSLVKGVLPRIGLNLAEQTANMAASQVATNEVTRAVVDQNRPDLTEGVGSAVAMGLGSGLVHAGMGLKGAAEARPAGDVFDQVAPTPPASDATPFRQGFEASERAIDAQEPRLTAQATQEAAQRQGQADELTARGRQDLSQREDAAVLASENADVAQLTQRREAVDRQTAAVGEDWESRVGRMNPAQLFEAVRGRGVAPRGRGENTATLLRLGPEQGAGEPVQQPMRGEPAATEGQYVKPGDEYQRGAVIAASAKQKGKFQVTYFDRNGFSSDQTFDSRDAAVKDVAREGFKPAERDTLAELGGTEQFRKGNDGTQVIRMLNDLIVGTVKETSDAHGAIMKAYREKGLDAAREVYRSYKNPKAAEPPAPPPGFVPVPTEPPPGFVPVEAKPEPARVEPPTPPKPPEPAAQPPAETETTPPRPAQQQPPLAPATPPSPPEKGTLPEVERGGKTPSQPSQPSQPSRPSFTEAATALRDTPGWAALPEAERTQKLADLRRQYFGKRKGFLGLPLPEPPAPTVGQNFTLAGESPWEVIRRKAQDEFRPVSRLQEDLKRQGGTITDESSPYLKEELFKGRTADQVREVEHEFVKPVVDRLGKSGLKVEDLDQYLTALHAPERNAHIAGINPSMPDAGSGMSNADAAAAVAKWQADPRFADLSYAANRILAMNRRTLKTQLDSGLISQQTHDELTQRWQNYVPLRTDMEAEGAIGKGKGFNVGGKEYKPATGRSSEADSPVTFSVMQANEKIIRAEKNRVGQSLLKLVRDNPDPELWTVDRHPTIKTIGADGMVRNTPDPRFKEADHVISVKEDGVAHLIEFHGDAGKRIAAAVKRIGHQDGFRLLHTAMRGYANLQTSLNPAFIVPNLARDLATAAFHQSAERGTKAALQTVINTPRAFRAMWSALGDPTKGGGGTYRTFADEYLAHGGKVDAYQLKSFESVGKQLQGLLKDADPSPARRMLMAARKSRDFIDRLNGAAENAVRLSAYVESRKSGATAERSASVAKNLTVNFNRRGEWGAAVNSLYLFANAGIQGNARMIQAISKSKAGKVMAGSILASGLAYGLLAPGLFGKDDEGRDVYDTIPEHIKATNLIVPTGSKTYAKLPLPYGFNAIFTAGRLMSEAMTKRKTVASAGGDLFAAGVDAFNPLGREATLLQTLSPTILDPLVQTAENQDWAGRQIVPTQNPFGPPKPDSQLARRDTSAFAKATAEFLNSVTGGDEVKPGKIDVSPATIDHYVGWATGGLGRTLKQASELPGKLAAKDVAPQDVPIASRFVGEVPRGVNGREFRDVMKAGEDALADLKHYESTGQAAKAAGLKQERGKELAFARYAQDIRRRGTELRHTLGEEGSKPEVDRMLSEFVKTYRGGELPKRWAVENELAELETKRRDYLAAVKDMQVVRPAKQRAEAVKSAKAKVMTARETARLERLRILNRQFGEVEKAEKQGRLPKQTAQKRLERLALAGAR